MLWGLRSPGTRPSRLCRPGIAARRLPHDPTLGWLCDPQRPVVSGGAVPALLPALGREQRPGGWDHHHHRWRDLHPPRHRHAPHRGFPVWSGCPSSTTANTAGFGAGAVIALATRPTGRRSRTRSSTSTGRPMAGLVHDAPGSRACQHRRPGGETPPRSTTPNGVRDPKVHWDALAPSG